VNILTSSDTWFRPSDVCVGPDGALYVADWNDGRRGRPQHGGRDLATMTGRVYRVAPPGFKSMPPRLDLKTAKGCVEALQSPNLSARYLAWTALKEMGDKSEANCENFGAAKTIPA